MKFEIRHSTTDQPARLVGGQFAIVRPSNAAPAQLRDVGCTTDPISCNTAVDEIDDLPQITISARMDVLFAPSVRKPCLRQGAP